MGWIEIVKESEGHWYKVGERYEVAGFLGEYCLLVKVDKSISDNGVAGVYIDNFKWV